MLSFVFLAEDWYEMQKKEDFEYDRLLEIVKHDLESLEFNIYHTWMKVLKRRLHKMIVPAIIESQSLPGFITNDGNRFLNKFLQTSSTPAYSMDDLLSLLNKIYKALRGYYIEDSIITQAVTELLKLVGVTAFNDLLLRRNFLSWKRGLQINYNITRIEEWCKSHDMPEGTLQLEHLMVRRYFPLNIAHLTNIPSSKPRSSCSSRRQHSVISRLSKISAGCYHRIRFRSCSINIWWLTMSNLLMGRS